MQIHIIGAENRRHLISQKTTARGNQRKLTI
jgi:hypothetical protein